MEEIVTPLDFPFLSRHGVERRQDTRNIIYIKYVGIVRSVVRLIGGVETSGALKSNRID